MDIGIYSDDKQQVEHVTTMRVSAISSAVTEGEVLFDWQAKALINSSTNFYKSYVDSLDESEVSNSFESLTSMYSEFVINPYEASLEEAFAMFLQRWVILILVLIVCLMAEVLNTFLNNILAKRKEFAILRTIGVKPTGIVNIIVTQISFSLSLCM